MKRLLVGIVFTLLVLSSAGPAAAQYDVKAAMVMDMGSGHILYEQNADRKIAPASLTKILTMYLVWEDAEQNRIKLTDKVKVSRAAAATGGSSMKLVRGEMVTVQELMAGMAIASGNDACVAVAEYLGGGVAPFVERMNRKARFLGMTSSSFVNPHGLPAKGQLTTARDMMRLASAYLRRFPESLVMHSKTHMYHNKIKRKNSNKLLGKMEGVDGLKTGYVASSGFNIVLTGQRNGRRLLAVVLGGRSSKTRNREARKLLETCFAMPEGGQVRLAQVEQRSHERPMQRNRPAIPDSVADSSPEINSGSYQETVYALHESSWKTQAKAKQRVGALRRRGLSVHMERVDLGSKGVWHRVYIGHFENMRQARNYQEYLSRKMQLRHALITRIDS